MVTLLDIISGILLAGGSFFILVGGIGLIRLPDFYARMHGAGVTDTLGAGLFIAGLMIQGGLSLITVKLLLILVFYFFASTVVGLKSMWQYSMRSCNRIVAKGSAFR